MIRQLPGLATNWATPMSLPTGRYALVASQRSIMNTDISSAETGT